MSASAIAPPAQAKRLPRAPGVYRFYDETGVLLYVGKASSLRARVMTYFQANAAKLPRNRLMVPRISRVEFTVTPTANDALLLEQEQIKGHGPRYNVLFRDDKSYPYLRISEHSHPRLALYRGKPRKDCHGPFANGWAVRESIRVLQRVFRLRTCTDSSFTSRTRPCLLHQIGQCSAPCVDHPDARSYAADVASARAFLAGAEREVTAALTTQMEAAAAREEFEDAARLRDSINALAEVRQLSAVTGGATEADFIAVYQGEAGTAVRLAAVRGARLVSELDFFPSNATDATADEVLAAFCTHHYAKHLVPRRVVVQSHIEAAVLRQLLGAAQVTVVTHPRGNDRERLAMVARNAQQALATHGSTRAAADEALTQLGEVLGIPAPRRIDCFDVSHSTGEAAVASCVVCVAGQMESRLYRRFNLRTTTPGDDCGGMREAVARRYRTAPTDPQVVPELLLIDGGSAQVAVVSATLADLAPHVPVLGIAKGAGRKPGLETLLTDAGELLELAPHTPAFRLLQRIRDEAHRFALDSHRKRRDRKRRGSKLEEVEGIGPQRRRQLINEFGGLAGLRKASPRDLSRIQGVGSELARRIYQALHS